ncbi:hypothetical protein LCL96_04185 [Rossellomorea aquimaris]|uniref:hypothetical protein n=1 Tax=Rossellomorea aquimaris TaxID=189382 RepID=UPI001CD76C1E|nr:hypothetical protein [Rossellomorea aquimaris]MCA1058116.1 hypothetical protein [Rossellomorea aquimaris]
MSVNVSGLDKLLAELENRYGKANVQRISDEALIRGANVFIKHLKSEFASFKDTGASIEEIAFSYPTWDGDVRTVKVHWKGPHGRYRIIHLNEFGTIKNPNPRGKGAIARVMVNAENAYRKAIRQAVVEGIK